MKKLILIFFMLSISFILLSCNDERVVDGSDLLNFVLQEDNTYLVESKTNNVDTKSLYSIEIPEQYENKPVTQISRDFFNNLKLVSIYIPKSITSIDDFSFLYNEYLEEINVSEDNEFYVSLSGVLYNKEKTTIIRYPASKEGNYYSIISSVVTVGKSSFEGAINLEKVVFPCDLIYIEDYAFKNVENLQDFLIPNKVQKIGVNAFENCKKIKNIIIPELILELDGTFKNCSSLNQIYLNYNILTIKNGVFQGVNNVIIFCDNTSPRPGWESNWNNNNKIVWNYSGRL